jgi:hypothetical protein
VKEIDTLNKLITIKFVFRYKKKYITADEFLFKNLNMNSTDIEIVALVNLIMEIFALKLKGNFNE